jgi:hypothetical protein
MPTTRKKRWKVESKEVTSMLLLGVAGVWRGGDGNESQSRMMIASTKKVRRFYSHWKESFGARGKCCCHCCCKYFVCIYMSALFGAWRLQPVVLASMMISCGLVVVAGGHDQK